MALAWRKLGGLLLGAIAFVVFAIVLGLAGTMVFLVPFAVENNTDSVVIVRARGPFEGSRACVGRPPMYWNALPLPLPDFAVEYRLEPHSSVSRYYDMDDVNFCWLAVRAEDARDWHLLRGLTDLDTCPAVPQRPKRCCWGLAPDFRFTINSLADAGVAPDWIVDGGCFDAP